MTLYQERMVINNILVIHILVVASFEIGDACPGVGNDDWLMGAEEIRPI